MPPAKLTESDKQEILALYRQPEETTANIASRYGVSSTTISRVLRQGLPDEEYESLMQQKRAMAFRGQENEPADESLATSKQASASRDEGMAAPTPDKPDTSRRRRKRSSVQSTVEASDHSDDVASHEVLVEQLSIANAEPLPLEAMPAEDEDVSVIESLWGEDLLDSEDDFDEDDLDDEDLEDEDLDEEDLGDVDEEMDDVHLHGSTKINILPLAEASLPKVCYLVIDRTAELITRPLKDFADLGQIPESDVQARTLPIFDNHRVAKRFLRRSQRVIKVPDGQMLQKTSNYLKAKGISCLLIDGQIYSLS
jgi:transposase-like protein